MTHCPHTKGLHARGYDNDYEDWVAAMIELYEGDSAEEQDGYLYIMKGDKVVKGFELK